jgi:seryl-tRNA synthetase
LVKDDLKRADKKLKEIEEKRNEALKSIPNLPADDVPVGKDESENKILRSWGEITNFDFEPKDHIQLGESLGLIDTKKSSEVSGSRFTYLKKDAVLLEFALINYAFETLVKEDFEPIIPPSMMKIDVFHKLGYAENLGSEEYYTVLGGDSGKSKGEEEAQYYLIGTAEHSIVPYFMNEMVDDLPKKFVGFSPAFRREAGSYGKDTKGIIRLHQFDKVEMVTFTRPEDSDSEHEYLLSLEEKIFQELKIPYQVIKMCTGDLGFPVSKKYDLEAWIPSQGKFREVTSTSNTSDYQARRLNIKFKSGDKTEYVHILNGTAFAIGRTLIAILENYQNKDGSVTIPKILKKWMEKDKIS